MNLDALGRGQTATITQLDTCGPQRQRLMDLGLIPGVEVGVEMTSPLGDPTAYRVLDAVVVLRRSQAREIQVAVGRGGRDD